MVRAEDLLLVGVQPHWQRDRLTNLAGFDVADRDEQMPSRNTSAAKTILAELEARSSGCIQVYADAPRTGTLIATLPIPATAVGAGWRTVQAETGAVAGLHAVFLVFQRITARSATSPSSASGGTKNMPPSRRSC
jgi:hypothetical protein